MTTSLNLFGSSVVQAIFIILASTSFVRGEKFGEVRDIEKLARQGMPDIVDASGYGIDHLRRKMDMELIYMAFTTPRALNFLKKSDDV